MSWSAKGKTIDNINLWKRQKDASRNDVFNLSRYEID